MFKRNKKKEKKDLLEKVSSPILKIMDEEKESNMLSRVSGGTVLALGVPVAFTGYVATVGTNFAGDIVESIGDLIAMPTNMLSMTTADVAKDTDNVLAKAGLYTVGAISAVPTVAIKLATGIVGGILKLGSYALGLASIFLTIPFIYGSAGILRLGRKKTKQENVIEISPDNIEIEDNDIEVKDTAEEYYKY